MANFFIERPVFAWVLAIIMMFTGGIAIMNLPVAQYPQIAPPTITISAAYPGADAKTVEDSVTQVIEQNMNGLDGLMYMSSTSDAAGNASIILTFKTGTSPDIAQVQVQNKLQLAMPSLPQEVQYVFPSFNLAPQYSQNLGIIPSSLSMAVEPVVSKDPSSNYLNVSTKY